MAVEISVFGKTKSGEIADRIILKNKSKMTLELTNYGCRVLKLLVPNKDDEEIDVVLGHNTIEEYYDKNFQGAFVGRYANRIGNAEFSLNGKEYKLTKNDGENSLHGGPMGYHQVLFDYKVLNDGDEPEIEFTHISPNNDEGFPGQLDIKVRYKLTKNNEFEMNYWAKSDEDTIYNPTNHSFFNLSGDNQKKITSTELTINAEKSTVVEEDLIPTGEIVDIKGTGLDFTDGKLIGKDIESAEDVIKMCGGFDHNFCVTGTGFRKHAKAYEDSSGVVMEVFSDMPGIQLYTFNSDADGLINKDGRPMKIQTGFCLETQYYPDSPNRSEFPFSPLAKDKEFTSKTIYKFSRR